MSLDYKFEPLGPDFPRPLTFHWDRSESRFEKPWKEVQIILERELRFLNYRLGSVILQTAHSKYEVTNAGKLRSDARSPIHPGVVIKFDVLNGETCRYEKMSFECDQFTNWKANVRAIADALEALRKVDRYGVTGSGKTNAHYEGFKALNSGVFGKAEAADFIALHSGFASWEIQMNQAMLTQAYRKAALKLHPDQGGKNDDFVKLQTAFELLKKELAEV